METFVSIKLARKIDVSVIFVDFSIRVYHNDGERRREDKERAHEEINFSSMYSDLHGLMLLICSTKKMMKKNIIAIHSKHRLILKNMRQLGNVA